MNLNLFPIVNLIILGAIISVILGILGWLRSGEAPLGKTFAVFSFGVALWIFSYGLELLFTSFTIKIFWGNMQFVGAGIAQTSFLILAFIYTNRKHLIKPPIIFWFCVVPALTILVAFTNQFHGLMREYLGVAYVRRPISFVSLEFEYGPWYWVNAAYMLSTVFIGCGLIARNIFRANRSYRKQGLALIIGILLPWVANLVLILGLNPIAPLDITILALLATNLLYANAIIRHRLFDLIPVARDTLIENLPDTVLVLNQNSQIVDINPAGLRTFNLQLSEILGKPVSNILPNSLESVLTPIGSMEKPISIETHLNFNSHDQFFNLTTTPLSNNDDKPDGWLITLADITQLKESENKIKQLLEAEREQRMLADSLRESSNILSTALDMESILDNLLILVRRVVPFDYARLFSVENGIARISRLSGYEKLPLDARLKTMTVSLEIEKTPNLKWMAENCEPLFITNVSDYDGWTKLTKDIDIQSWVGAPIFSHQELIGFISLTSSQPNLYNQEHANRLNAFAGQVSLAIQTARLFDELRRMAVTDSLTSLFNRRHFFDLARLEFERARRYGENLSVIMLDIDHFKQVNDAYGHVAGDSVLSTLARVCRADLREMDILARYGGEEFVILLPNTDLNSAAKTAERLRVKMETTEIELDTTTRREAAGYASNTELPSHLSVTISLGVSALEKSIPDLENLINRSDHALYDAKQSGRNCVRVWKTG